MRKQKRNQKLIDIKKVKRQNIPRKMRTDDALKIAIRNGTAMAEQIQKWIDENEYDERFVLAQHADGIYTHLYCETEENQPFPMIFYKLNAELGGVIKTSMDEIALIKISVDPKHVEEGLDLKILSLMFIQKDRRDTFIDSVAKYKIALKEERRV